MLKNYFKIAIRSILRKRIFSLVNMLGLSIGLASCMIISAYIISELDFDKFHPDADRIYRVIETVEGGNLGKRNLASVEGALGHASKTGIAGIEDVMRVFELGVLNLKRGDNEFGEPFFSFDESFFNFFGYKLIEGSADAVFKNPGSVVLSESYAKKYFGDENPIGQSIEAQTNSGVFMVMVTGIMEDMPENSHLNFDIVFPHSTPNGFFNNFLDSYNTNWDSPAFNTYFKLVPGVNEEDVVEAINNLAKASRPETPGRTQEYSLQPLRDIHFLSQEIDGDLNYRESDLDYIYIFSIIGLIILLIALANYVNLSTVNATERIKEIGLRRVIGARRGQLMAQFMSESVLFSFLSFAVAFTLIQLTRPLFTQLFGIDILQFVLVPGFFIPVCIIVFGIGVFSGLYPALIVSRGKTVNLLKNQTINGNRQTFFKGLVLFQFIISLGMIIVTIGVYSQIDYIERKDLGYNEESIALIEINSNKARENQDLILEEFGKLSAVQSSSAVSRVPAEWKAFFEIEVTVSDGTAYPNIPFLGVDENFLNVFEIDLLSGRNFRPSIADSLKVIINETLARQLNITEADGQVVNMTGIKRGAQELAFRNNPSFQVVGIVKDFHFQSLREEIPPMIFAYKLNPIQNIDYFAVKLKSNNLANSMLELKEVMKKFDPSPFDYNFLEAKLGRYYQEDAKRSKLFILASSIAIFIAFIGLFALVHATLQKRIKELGIRKVLGAGTKSLLGLLSKDYLMLLMVAMLISSPLAYLGISNWLGDFVYKVEISWWFFGLALIVCLSITALATGMQIGKAISRNPSDVLRSE